MESISAFKRNIFVSYPSNYENKQKTMLSLAGKDLFEKQENLDTEISYYLDILYRDTDENFLKKIDKLKLNGAYSPMKCQNLHYNNFYL